MTHTSGVGRRRFLGGLGAAAVGVPLATAQATGSPTGSGPVTVWGTSQDALPFRIADQTVRLAVRVSAGSRTVRIRVSNAFGTAPLDLGSVHVGRRLAGAAVRAGSNRAGSFSGLPGIVVPPGAEVLTDPIALLSDAGDDLLVSLYVRSAADQVTGHLRPKDFSYLSSAGDHGADETGTAFPTPVEHWFFADAVVADGIGNAGAVVFLGDSITDSGSLPRGGYQGWTDFLGQRIAATRPPSRRLGIVNAAISGNRLITQRPGAGVNAQARLDRDALSHAGVHTLVLLEGINDLYGTNVTARELITAQRQLAARARSRGLRVVVGTLIPSHRGAYTTEREAVRTTLNDFLRTSPEFDGVLDFDAALRDPADHTSILPRFDSGDHTHPSPDGYRAMSDAVDLALLYP